MLVFAERQGFEPWIPKGYNGFRDRPDRPLRHLSKKRYAAFGLKCGAKVRNFAIKTKFNHKKNLQTMQLVDYGKRFWSLKNETACNHYVGVGLSNGFAGGEINAAVYFD